MLGDENWSASEEGVIGVCNQVSLYLGAVGISSAVVCFRRVLYRGLLAKPEGRTPLGRPRLRCEENVKMDLKEVGVGMWIESNWLEIWTDG